VFDLLGSTTLGSDVTVLLVVGRRISFLWFSRPRLFGCGDVAEKEALYFSPAVELSTNVLPESGHSRALRKNAGECREAIRTWLCERLCA
jgi:hypothetical protein